MSEQPTAELSPETVEQVLREELAQGDLAIASARPILRHLLTNDDEALFSDEIVARIRGMARDVARQLLEAQAEAEGIADRTALTYGRQDSLAQAMCQDPGFLAHAHALAIEAQLIERLSARSGMDPVLSPLVQELAAGANGAAAALAMQVLAAQARFVQYHRRMELPLRDLPAELFHKALLALRHEPGDHAGAAAAAERALRGRYEEAAGRQALLARLVTSMDGRAVRALAIDHAGLSIFATALAMASGQDRDLAVLSLGGRQFARLALSLRAAGLSPSAVEAQFLYLHPDTGLPEGFELLRADSAAALLTAAPREAVL
jgi:hypothetical protein